MESKLAKAAAAFQRTLGTIESSPLDNVLMISSDGRMVESARRGKLPRIRKALVWI